jgi:hypothetical protein
MWRILVSVVVLSILFIRTRFWVQQPVRHFYDFKCGPVPPSTRYYDPLHVKTFLHTDEDLYPILQFIREHSANYYPDEDDIRPFFTLSTVSIYVAEGLKGCIVARPVDVRLGATTFKGALREYMIAADNSIVKQLLCSHGVDCKTPGVFYSDEPIPWVSPFVTHPIWWTKTHHFKREKGGRCVRVTDATMRPLIDLLSANKTPCRITPSIDMLRTYLLGKVYSAFLVLNKGKAVAAFFFKKTSMLHENLPVLDCIGVVQREPVASAFSNLMYFFRKEYPVVRVYGLAHAPPTKAFRTTHRRYYLYGYYCKTFAAPDCFLL